MKGWMGLCLALVICVGGCQLPPSVAFSNDGKTIACQLPAKGFVIKDVAANKKIGEYDVGGAYNLAWSPANRYLVWCDGPILAGGDDKKPVARVLDLTNKNIIELSTAMGGPFSWESDHSLIGFAAPPKNAKDQDTCLEIHYDLATKTFRTEKLGPYVPAEFFPGSHDLLALNEDGLWKVHAKHPVEIWKLKRRSWVPCSATPRRDGRVIVCESRAERRALSNRAFLVDEKGKAGLSLPASTKKSFLLHNSIRKLLDVSCDGRWLLIVKAEDESPKKLLATSLLCQSLEGSPKQLPVMRRLNELKNQQSVRYVFQLVSRSSGKTVVLGTTDGDADLKALTDIVTSPDNRRFSVSVDTSLGQRVWLVDGLDGGNRLIASHDGTV